MLTIIFHNYTTKSTKLHNQKLKFNTYLILESFIDEVHVNGVAQERGGLGLAALKGGLQVLLKDD